MKPAESRILRPGRWALPAALVAQPRAVVTVSAPAGYGKSTLLSEWRREIAAQRIHVVWLVVDEGDRDGDKLTVDLLHAFAPADAQRSQMLLGGAGTRGKRAVIMALLAEIAARGGRTVLFIDDIHWLAETTAGSTLRLLVAHQPDHLGLVLSGRSNTSALVSEALMEGRLTRFTASQLAFNAQEVHQLLRQHGVEAGAALVQGIAQRTHGWPAVVRLVAMTLEDDPRTQDALLQGLLDRTQALTDYLSDVLLARIPPRSASFLLGISVLRRFSVALAGATVDMHDAGDLLDDLERRALPFSRSEDPSLPLALHPLVREFLLARLRRGDPAQLARYGERALAWFNAQGRIDAAIDLSLDIGDIAGAAALIDRFAHQEARHHGRHAIFLYWANKLPADQLSRFPKIQMIRVWSLNVVRQYAEADAILHDLDTQLAQGRVPEPERESLAQQVELERCIQLTIRDQWAGLAPRVRRWLEQRPDVDRLNMGMAQTMVGCGLLATSEFEDALASLRLGQRLMREANAHYVAAWGDMWGISALVKQGQYRQALYECEEAIAQVVSHLGGQTPAEIMLHAMRGFLLYEFNRLEEAGAALEHGLTALVEQSSVDSLIMGYVALARLQNANEAPADALEMLAEGEVLGWAHGLPRLAIALAAERIDILLRLGEANQALALWQDLRTAAARKAPAGFANVLGDKAMRIESRIALSQGDAARAASLLDPALEHARRTQQKRKEVELLLLQAQARQALGQAAAALDSFHRAVEVAMPQNYLRVFADEGPRLHALVTAALDPASPRRPGALTVGYLRQIAEAVQPVATPASGARSVPAGDALTPREQRILGKLQSGLSNRELADALFITEGTLKWHLKNIYSKLGVANRLAAVTLGRQMGLVSDASLEPGVRRAG